VAKRRLSPLTAVRAESETTAGMANGLKCEQVTSIVGKAWAVRIVVSGELGKQTERIRAFQLCCGLYKAKSQVAVESEIASLQVPSLHSTSTSSPLLSTVAPSLPSTPPPMQLDFPISVTVGFQGMYPRLTHLVHTSRSYKLIDICDLDFLNGMQTVVHNLELKSIGDAMS
jgi:hypothetical protein